MVDEIDARVEKAVALYGRGRVLNRSIRLTLWNALADQAVFLLSRR
jgi:hypothetical protein